MGLEKLFYRTRNKKVVVEDEPHQIICQNMSEAGRFFALYSKDGQYLVDHFGRFAEDCLFKPDEAFYLVVNLNFVQSFYNCAQMGIYNFRGTELISPELVSFKLVHHLTAGEVIQTSQINLEDYSNEILLTRLKKPKEWKIPVEGLIRINLQVSLIFNPVEIENFLLKIPISN